MVKKKVDTKAPYPHAPNPLSDMSCHETENIKTQWAWHELPAATVAILKMVPPFPETKEDLDYALLPNGKIIRLKPDDYKDHDKKKYPDAIPIIWENWLYGPPADGIATLSLGEANVIAATGLKGNGKSETLAYLSSKALALDMPVWSNLGVKFWLANSEGKLKLCETNPLDWSAVLALKKDLEKGALVIDELSYFASSRLSGSVRNRIINAAVNQVRKRTLDFFCSVKFLRQIDVNIREELDAHFTCEDIARSAKGQSEGLPKGCFIRWLVRDISGWSGSRNDAMESIGFDSLGEPVYKDGGDERLATLRFTWPIYNSYEVVETADAFRKVRLDLEETVISDKQGQGEVDALLAEIIDNYRDVGGFEVSCDDFRQSAAGIGIRMNEKQLGKVLKDSFGVIRKRRSKENVYILDEDD